MNTQGSNTDQKRRLYYVCIGVSLTCVSCYTVKDTAQNVAHRIAAERQAAKEEESREIKIAKEQESAAKLGSYLDDAEKYLEDYGSISISVPLLTKLGEDFSFNLKQGGTNYYNDAKN